MALTFDWSPHPERDPAGPRSAEAESLGRLQVRLQAGGGLHNLTEAVDRDTDCLRRDLFLPGVVLAQRICSVWPSAVVGRRSPPAQPVARAAARAWRRAHSLALLDGGVQFPRIELWRGPAGAQHIRALPDPPPADPSGAGLRFCAAAHAEVDARELRRALRGFVGRIHDRLQALGVDDGPARALASDHALISSPRPEDRRLITRLGAAGWCLGACPPEVRHGLLALQGDDLLVVAVLELSPAEPDLDGVRGMLAAVEGSAGRPDEADAPRDRRRRAQEALLRAAPPHPDAGGAWTTGWRAAEQVRKALQLQPLAAVGALTELVPRAQPLAGLRDERSTLLRWTARGGAARWTGPGDPPRPGPQHRFRAMRDLHLLLTSPEPDGARALGPGLDATTSAANAFAAELMAPRDEVRRLLAGADVVSADRVSTIARRLGAPLKVVEHQIENHEMAQIGDW